MTNTTLAVAAVTSILGSLLSFWVGYYFGYRTHPAEMMRRTFLKLVKQPRSS